MARRIRQPPAVSEKADPRAPEYFARDIEDLLKLVGERTLDVGSIAAGSVATFSVTVAGCRPDRGQTVQLGLPAAFSTGLIPYGFVSAADSVMIVLRNSTGSAIDPPNAVYSVRVMP